jgi:hypothetical protein
MVFFCLFDIVNVILYLEDKKRNLEIFSKKNPKVG